MPSVTRICEVIDKSGPLLGWAVRSANDIWRGSIQPDTPYPEIFLEQVYETAKSAHRVLKADAASVGTQAHKAVEQYLHNLADGPEAVENNLKATATDERVIRCFQAARKWLDENHVTFSAIERRVYSRKHKFSGTLDGLGEISGRVCLLDWKSSKGIYPEHRLQTAAYVHAYEEETGDTVSKRYLIRLGKADGAFEAHEYKREEQKKDWRAFLAALKLWRRLQEIK